MLTLERLKKSASTSSRCCPKRTIFDTRKSIVFNVGNRAGAAGFREDRDWPLVQRVAVDVAVERQRASVGRAGLDLQDGGEVHLHARNLIAAVHLQDVRAIEEARPARVVDFAVRARERAARTRGFLLAAERADADRWRCSGCPSTRSTDVRNCQRFAKRRCTVSSNPLNRGREVRRVRFELLVVAERARHLVEHRDGLIVRRARVAIGSRIESGDGSEPSGPCGTPFSTTAIRSRPRRPTNIALTRTSLRRLELDAERAFVGMRLLQIGIDGRDRSAEGEQHRSFFTWLVVTVSVGIVPPEPGSAQPVLVRYIDEARADGVVVPRVASLDRELVRAEHVVHRAEPRAPPCSR